MAKNKLKINGKVLAPLNKCKTVIVTTHILNGVKVLRSHQVSHNILQDAIQQYDLQVILH